MYDLDVAEAILKLRADVARLTRERDEAIAERDKLVRTLEANNLRLTCERAEAREALRKHVAEYGPDTAVRIAALESAVRERDERLARVASWHTVSDYERGRGPWCACCWTSGAHREDCPLHGWTR